MTLAPHQERVVAERAALADNASKLVAFVGGAAFPTLPDAERLALSWQLSAMRSYLNALDARLALWGVGA